MFIIFQHFSSEHHISLHCRRPRIHLVLEHLDLFLERLSRSRAIVLSLNISLPPTLRHFLLLLLSNLRKRQRICGQLVLERVHHACLDEAYGDAYCVVCRRSLIWNPERFRETIQQSPLFTPVCKGACPQVRDMSLVIREEEHAFHWLMPFDVEYTWYLELIQEVKVDCELRVVENEVAASVLKAKRRLAIAKAMLPTVLAFEESGVQTIPFDLFFAIGSVCL
jgi:hypothetical protein